MIQLYNTALARTTNFPYSSEIFEHFLTMYFSEISTKLRFFLYPLLTISNNFFQLIKGPVATLFEDKRYNKIEPLQIF